MAFWPTPEPTLSCFLPGSWPLRLEISSPGLDEPLKLNRQYVKNIGRFVEVDDINDMKREGKLISVTTEEIEIEEIKGKGKKVETVQHTISFSEIKTTKIQIKF